ncbi:MAG: hypothetical protein HKM24_01195 [Gammaproteobacteria bacterium]|nr:hypothetical protein [Gammaproteobacteria bacterium]
MEHNIHSLMEQGLRPLAYTELPDDPNTWGPQSLELVVNYWRGEVTRLEKMLGVFAFRSERVEDAIARGGLNGNSGELKPEWQRKAITLECGTMIYVYVPIGDSETWSQGKTAHRICAWCPKFLDLMPRVPESGVAKVRGICTIEEQSAASGTSEFDRRADVAFRHGKDKCWRLTRSDLTQGEGDRLSSDMSRSVEVVKADLEAARAKVHVAQSLLIKAETHGGQFAVV